MTHKKIIFALAVSTFLFVWEAGAIAQNKAVAKEATMIVTATKTEHLLKDVPGETVLISRQEIEQSGAKTVAALLNTIPGFNFSQQSDLVSGMGYKNTVRGLNVESRYMLVLVDGQRVFTGFHSGGMAGAGFAHNVNVVPVDMIERIEVVKGPGSALYGSDAMVGVLNIITRRASDETVVSGGAEYGVYQVSGNNYMGFKPEDTSRNQYKAHVFAGGPLSEKIRGMLAVSREGNEGIHPTAYDIFRNYIHGRLSMNLTDDFQMTAGAEYIAWEEEESNLGDHKEETAPRLYATADYSFSPAHKLHFSAYYQNLDADFADPMYGNTYADVRYSDAELTYTGKFGQHHLITLGAEYLKEDLDTDKVKNVTRTTNSVYFQDEMFFLQDRLVIVPGVRYDDNDTYGEETNPKLSAMYRFATGTTLRASVGCSFKAPSAQKTSSSPTNHVVQWILANPDLKPETSVTWQAGIEQPLLDHALNLGALYYHMDVEDMIQMAPLPTLYNGVPSSTWKNLDEAQIKGIEAHLDWKIVSGLNFRLGYAYTNAKDKKTDKRLVNTPEHSMNAALEYTNDAYLFGGTLSFGHTGDQENMVFMPTSSPLTESFTTVGLSLWKDFSHGRLSVKISNLFDEELKGSDTIYVGRSVVGCLELFF